MTLDVIALYTFRVYLSHNLLKLEAEYNYFIGSVRLDAIKIPTFHLQREFKLLK